MSKTLSNRGYGILKSTLHESELRALRAELTVQPYAPPGVAMGPPPAKFAVYKESPQRVYVPKAFGLERYGAPDEDMSSDGVPLGPNASFVADLRDNQREPVAAFLDACRDPLRRGGVLSMGCAAGKTVMALYCIAQLGRRAMVVAHKDFLLEQWRERISLFMPGARVGLIKGKVVDVDDCDIILASLQSMSMKDYPMDTFAGIGFLIVDETHRIATEVFSRALLKLSAKYTLGLSATVQRRDGMHKVFLWWLGGVVFSKKRDHEEVSVRMVRFRSSDPEYCSEPRMFGDRLNTAAMVNNICSFQPRTQLIVDLIDEVIAGDQGRRVLVLGDRKAMLRDLHTALTDERGIEAGFYYGGLKQEDLDASAKKQVVLATFAMSSEGLDIPALNCLLLCSPKTEIEQSVGRILRTEAHKRQHKPLIIDIVDDFSVFRGQAAKRRKFYRRFGYDVVNEGSDEQQDDPEVSSGALDFSNKCLL